MLRLVCSLSILLALITTTAAQTNVTTNGGTVNYLSKFTGASSIGNSSLFESNGNVGLGTSAPGKQMEISGSNAGLRLTNTLATQYSGPALDFFNSQGAADNHLFNIAMYKWGTGNSGGYGLSFRRWSDNGASFLEALVFDSSNNSVTINNNAVGFSYGNFIVANGNMGVGTRTPAQKLDVAGNIRITGAGSALIFPNGSVQTTASAGTITGVTAGSGLVGGGMSGNVSLAVDSTVARTNTNQTFNGNLTVNGTVTATHVNSTDFTTVMHGKCITGSYATPYVLNGLGQSHTTDCTYGPGTPMNPVLGTVIPYSGIMSGLRVVQTSIYGATDFGGTIQVYTEPFDQSGGWTLTTLTCTLTKSFGNPANSTTTCSDLSHTLSVTAGQKILVLVTPPTDAGSFAPVSAIVSIMF